MDTSQTKSTIGTRLVIGVGGAFVLGAWGAMAPWIGTLGIGSLVAQVAPGLVHARGILNESLGYAAIALNFLLIPLGGLAGFVVSLIGGVSAFWKRWLGVAVVMFLLCVGAGVLTVMGG